MARVLVVDDVKFISRMLDEIFSKAGHDVEIATNGREALAKVSAGTPELVVLDVSIPEVDGLEVARTVKEDPRSSHIPILIVTSRTDEKTRNAATEIGVEGFVVKPFEASVLVRTAAELLRNARPAARAADRPEPTTGPPRRSLGPGLEVEEHPKALVVRLGPGLVEADVFQRLEPEVQRSGRGVLVDWRTPSASDGLVHGFVRLAERLEAESRMLRIVHMPEAVAGAFATIGQDRLLVRSDKNA